MAIQSPIAEPMATATMPLQSEDIIVDTVPAITVARTTCDAELSAIAFHRADCPMALTPEVRRSEWRA